MQQDMILLFQKKQQNPREEHWGNSLTQPIKDIRINIHKQQAEDTIQMFFQATAGHEEKFGRDLHNRTEGSDAKITYLSFGKRASFSQKRLIW